MLNIKILFVAFSVAILKSDANDKFSEIKSSTRTQSADGFGYGYEFDSTNGIHRAENGIGGAFVTGESHYISREGDIIKLKYKADENGFRAQGDHLPTPPPIPGDILRALQYIKTHSTYEDILADRQLRADERLQKITHQQIIKDIYRDLYGPNYIIPNILD